MAWLKKAGEERKRNECERHERQDAKAFLPTIQAAAAWRDGDGPQPELLKMCAAPFEQESEKARWG